MFLLCFNGQKLWLGYVDLFKLFRVDGAWGADSQNSLTSLWGLPLPWQFFVLASKGRVVWRDGESTTDVFNLMAPKVWSFQWIFSFLTCKTGMQIGMGGGKGKEGRKTGWSRGFSLLQCYEDINWTLASLFLLSWQDGIWMPYSKRALSLLSGLNKELNLFNNAWAFTLTQHFLPFFSCTTFSILARGFLMTLHEDSQCTRWTSPMVRWPMFMEALPRVGIFFLWCDVLFTVCIQGVLWYV